MKNPPKFISHEIRERLKLGHTLETIEKDLILFGYHEKEVHKALNEFMWQKEWKAMKSGEIPDNFRTKLEAGSRYGELGWNEPYLPVFGFKISLGLIDRMGYSRKIVIGSVLSVLSIIIIISLITTHASPENMAEAGLESIRIYEGVFMIIAFPIGIILLVMGISEMREVMGVYS
jgi:hypothetical protein